MAVAVCPPVTQSAAAAQHVERYYSMDGTPSPQSVPHVYYPELDEEAFQSDEEIQKVC